MTDYRYGLAAALAGFTFSGAALAAPPSYTLTSFDVPGASPQLGGTLANGINDHGEIVGIYGNSSRGGASGFLYSRGKFTSLDHPEAGSLTSANGIDNRGEIVGDFFDTSSKVRGFILTAGHFVTIDVPGGKTLSTSAEGIDNRGTAIVGIFTVPRGTANRSRVDSS
jgi:uncharacterized membrane protein